jgi:hypothetical protein
MGNPLKEEVADSPESESYTLDSKAVSKRLTVPILVAHRRFRSEYRSSDDPISVLEPYLPSTDLREFLEYLKIDEKWHRELIDKWKHLDNEMVLPRYIQDRHVQLLNKYPEVLSRLSPAQRNIFREAQLPNFNYPF